MSSLTSAPVAEVLEHLFADAARTQKAFLERTAQLPPATDQPGGGRPGDSRAFFAMAKDVHLAVSRETGTLLYVLARLAGPARSSSSAPPLASRRSVWRRR